MEKIQLGYGALLAGYSRIRGLDLQLWRSVARFYAFHLARLSALPGAGFVGESQILLAGSRIGRPAAILQCSFHDVAVGRLSG